MQGIEVGWHVFSMFSFYGFGFGFEGLGFWVQRWGLIGLQRGKKDFCLIHVLSALVFREARREGKKMRRSSIGLDRLE